jgi:hypothetical protein
MFAGVKPANIHIRALGQQVVEHAQHGGEADPGGDQHHRRVCLLCRKKSPAGGMMSTVSPM